VANAWAESKSVSQFCEKAVGPMNIKSKRENIFFISKKIATQPKSDNYAKKLNLKLNKILSEKTKLLSVN
jgi:hypothetical protein